MSGLNDSHIINETKLSILEDDYKVTGVKEIPSENFVINFNHFLINRKLNYFQKDQSYDFNDVGIEELKLADFFLQINDKYGEEIE